MSYGFSCPPSCVIPTCVPSCSPSVNYPIGGLGSLSSCGGIGGALSVGGGAAAAASSLGLLHGASVGCVTQAPPSEIVILPKPFTVMVPGPVLSTSCEPVRVGGYTACSSGGSSGGYLSSGPGLLGSRRGAVYRPC